MQTIWKRCLSCRRYLGVQTDKDNTHRAENEGAYENGIKLGSNLICTGQTVKAPNTWSNKEVNTMIHAKMRAMFNTLDISKYVNMQIMLTF